MLKAAREWSVPPWVIADECSERWWRWYVEDNNVRVEVDRELRRKLESERGQ